MTVIFILIHANKTLAQTVTIGPYQCNWEGNDVSIGSFAYSNPSMCSASDDNYATATATAAILVSNTNYLMVKDFGIEVPANATVTGIKAEIERSAVGISILAWAQDHTVKLIKNNTIAGNNKAKSTDYTGSDVTANYGGTGDLWGLSLTPTDVNSANFGLAFSAGIHGILALIPTVKIDNIRITVYYTPSGLPVSWLYFRVKAVDDETKLEWATATEKDSDFFIVEKSTDHHTWTEEGKIMAAGNSTTRKNYSFKTDSEKENKTSYFRLKQVDFDGQYSYSEIIEIKPSLTDESFQLTKKDDRFVLDFYSDEIKQWEVSLISLNGITCYDLSVDAVKGFNTIDISSFSGLKGCYLLLLSDGRNRFSKKYLFN